MKVKRLNFWQSIRGLIGRENLGPVLIKTRFGIHTLELKKPIEVLVLEKIKISGINPKGSIPHEKDIYRIVKIKKSLFPNRLFFWNPKYNTILEDNTGAFKKLQRGNIIALNI